ncbi:aminotransferase class III-fold pyridoxal phosphate-dependent enzyme [Pseudoalteromonas tunicata]|uniref:aminotransferase class III-fold pyridoxal phosphate-dependent enzyme n=1 Tax=Pseudoalteromonas tunicata TaxID=314281 RepID=UPI00273DB30F|nr:aminotransferase class III-fold pyridoxal phosphate-dependent enzyme [Pseudoalteromonas tunicata]MDP4982053.1 aminotransferase class III-fold pyridoxal phosphate-dependent enzyme [Pseudoalteromonas tunicata]
MQIRVGQEVLSRESLLESAGLLAQYIRAQGDMLTWQKEDERIEVLDMVGGFGSTLLGHNHPELLATMQQSLSSLRPMWVQGAERPVAKQLRNALAQKLLRETGKKYSIVLLNTGTEAVEAGLKHAQYEFFQRLQHIQQHCDTNWREFKLRLARNEIQLTSEFYLECERLLQQEPIESLEELQRAVQMRNQAVFNSSGKIAAFKGDFHGKTRGSLATTYNRDARLPFIANNPDAIFIDDEAQFKATLASWQKAYFTIEFAPLRLQKKPVNLLTALIYEPIQGEGGVRPLNARYCALLNELKLSHPDVAIIADEIQCGLGRTGQFLESQAINTPNDYITLAKSLGGGLCKISALAVEQTRYHEEFSMLHSTTFADDDLSSAVALKTLAILERDELTLKAAHLGEQFTTALNALALEYPDMIADIRGKGCMLGIELAAQENHPSATIAGLDEQNMLAMAIAGHLLHRHHIRVLPSLGKRRVLRLQPSAYLDAANIALVVDALKETFELIRHHHVATLLAHLIHTDKPHSAFATAYQHPIREEAIPAGVEKVGFISHLIDEESLNEIDPSWRLFEGYEQEELNQHILPITVPGVLARRLVTSATGRKIELVLYGIQMDAESIEADRRFNQAKIVRAQVNEAYRLAREEGCRLVGFGGYTSIVTNNCCDYYYNEPATTSGNALTVAASINTILNSAQDHGINLAKATVAICGAAGNIGQVHSAILAKHCHKLLLITRNVSANNMAMTLNMICEQLYQAVSQDQQGGILVSICRDMLASRIGHEAPKVLIDELKETLLARQLVRISEHFNDCQQADIIVSNTSSPTTVIDAQHVNAHKPVLISDVAVPRDVPVDIVNARPNIKLIRGGVVNLPINPSFTLPGMLLPTGQVYACCGETMLLGLAGAFSHFSMGALTCEQVEQVQALAAIHGFELDQEKPQYDALQAAS